MPLWYATHYGSGGAGVEGPSTVGQDGEVLTSKGDGTSNWGPQSGGITDAPSDGTPYSRQDAAWVNPADFYTNPGAGVELAGQFDGWPSGGNDTRFLLLDLNDGIVKRVEVGDADSAGTGYKTLRIRNGTTYFVATGGTDTPGGTTPATAFQTIAYAIGQSKAGDTILLNRGDTFTEILNRQPEAAADPSERDFGAYGTGNQPVVTSDGDFGTIAGDNVNLEDLEVRNTRVGATIATVWLAGLCAVRRCNIYSNSQKAGLFQSAVGSIAEDCNFIAEVSCAQCVTLFQCQDCIIRRCVIRREVAAGNTSGFHIHGAGSRGHLVEDCVIESTETNPSANFYSAIYIREDFVTQPGYPFVFRRNRITGTKWHNIVRTFSAGEVEFYQNLVEAFDMHTSGVVFQKAATAGCKVDAYSNTIVCDASVFICVGFFENISFIGNICQEITGTGGMFYLNNGITTLDNGCDYNYWFGSTRTTAWGGANFATWQGQGNDANGANADPQLQNPSSEEYWLQSGSPCSEAVADLMLQLSRLDKTAVWPDGVMVGNAPHIGAFLRDNQ